MGKCDAPDVGFFDEEDSPCQAADQGDDEERRMAVNDMKKAEGKGGDEQKNQVTGNAGPFDLRKENASEEEFLDRTQEENIKQVYMGKVFLMIWPAKSGFIHHEQPDPPDEAEEKVPSQGRSECIGSESQLMEAVLSVKTEASQPGQDTKKGMEPVFKGNEFQPDQNYRGKTDEKQEKQW